MTARRCFAAAAAVWLVVLLAVCPAPAAGQPSPDATRALSRVPAPIGPQGARRELYTGSYALLVGMSRYDRPTVWRSLDSVPAELDAVAAALRDAGFDAVQQVSNPTGAQLRDTVAEFVEKYGYATDHRLVFFFSGHGYTLDNGTRGYFVPRDAPDPAENEPSFRRIALSMDQVATWARDIRTRHVLFSFDSCFSGTIFRTRDRMIPQRISELTAKPVREFLSAGDAGEPVPAESVFTPTFIRAIRGAADLDGDGFVTGIELGNYVQREVIAYRRSQTPQFGKIRHPDLDQGDVVFAVPGGASPTGTIPPNPPPPPQTPSAPPAQDRFVDAGADRDAIVAALNAFRSAYEGMNVDALRQIFPKFENLDSLRASFADLRAVAVAMNPSSARITINPDGTATAVALYSVTFTSKTGRLDTFPKRATNANFRLRRSGGGWVIEQIEYR